jgi:transposase-like protein
MPHTSEPAPPCPWCGQDRIRELQGSSESPDSRFFTCEGCARTFEVKIVPLDQPRQQQARQKN